jgi:AraC-like DNA-binding protein
MIFSYLCINKVYKSYMNRQYLRLRIIILFPLLVLTLKTGYAENPVKCPMEKLVVEQLPDLHTPRSGHCVFFVNGELTVAGGHTMGFVPTPTAEYFSGGKWHSMNMVYTHDDAIFSVLRSGRVLLAGGHECNLGIGQTFEAEMYDPVSHTFKGFSCLDTKRTLASAQEIGGKVIITGNWYADDAVEVFDGNTSFSFVRAVSQQRSYPYILRTSSDDVMIFSSYDTRGHPHDSVIVDCLRGVSFTPNILKRWKFIFRDSPLMMDEGFIGDESKGIYAYLLPAMKDSMQLGILQTAGTSFSELPTVCPIPMMTPWGPITYSSQLLVDRQAKMAYVLGSGKNTEQHCRQDYRLYLLCIDYGHLVDGKAPLTLRYTDPQERPLNGTATLLPDGNLVLTGGIPDNSNFFPSASVFLLHTGLGTGGPREAVFGWPFFWIGLSLLFGLALVAFVVWRKLHVRSVKMPLMTGSPCDTLENDTDSSPEWKGTLCVDAEKTLSVGDGEDGLETDSCGDNDVLMDRICALMEEAKPFLNSNLKLSEFSDMLGVGRNAVSACINRHRACSFPQFVAGYRVEYAKLLMGSQPDSKILHVWMNAGFANETTFFRTFKSCTGMTPNEWKSQK